MDDKTHDRASKKRTKPTTLPTLFLQQLLIRHKVPFNAEKLEAACQKINNDHAKTALIKKIQLILSEANIKGVRPAQLLWRRFDQRRLPALVFCNKTWYAVTRAETEAGEAVFLDAENNKKELTDEMLQDALVVWLQVRQRAEKPAFLSLKGNIAARIIWQELLTDKAWLINIAIATVMINALAIGTSIFAMQVYDRVVPTLAYATLTTLTAGMMIIVLIDWFLKTIRAKILDSVSCAVDKRVSQKVFDHLLHIQLDLQPRSLGSLAAQVGSLDSVRQFFSSSIIFTLIDLPFALMFIAFIMMIGDAVGWVYVLLLPVALLLGIITQIRLKKLLHNQMIRSNERQGLLVDCIRGAESIRANNATWRFSEEWRSISSSIARYNLQQKAVSGISSVTTSSLSTIAYVSAVVVGVGQIEQGNITMGALIACSILGGRVIAPISASVQHLAQWQQVSEALQMVNQLFQLDGERRNKQDLLLLDDRPQTLELSKVRFAYPDSPIKQVNIEKLSFKPGDRVLLMGKVGCGKSTLLKVLSGLYRPSEGRVRLGNADLWEVDPQIVATHLGYLPQTVHLFKGTLRSNLSLSGAVGDARLLRISRYLGIDTIAANSPLGMDLEISEGGEGLSGGQRQLVAMARLLIARPRIWLLDEPTASLDKKSEKRLWQVLKKSVRPEDIVIVSTHRPMSADNFANRIIVMDQGEVSKDGKPEKVLPQLLSQNAKKPLKPVVTHLNQRGKVDVI
ncbi:MAG: ATP-binding cassette domain-containing protein [Gammaproteobacteria bacterium]|nr:ATP-binding cassette domain-containing protein [Gammaproteobacteria bacterium]